jgi:hypothetical protein
MQAGFRGEKEMSSNSCSGTTSGREGIENGGFYTPVEVRGKMVRENENTELSGKLWEFTRGNLLPLLPERL